MIAVTTRSMMTKKNKHGSDVGDDEEEYDDESSLRNLNNNSFSS